MTHLEDYRINIKIKLSAMWASLMLCYVYCDFFTLFVPGHIQSLMDGQSGVGKTTPASILMFALLMSVPALMVFLSVALPSKINRRTNITVGIIFTLIMTLVVATSLGEWMLFYIYFGIVEIALASAIVWRSWNWPRQETLGLK